MSLGRWLLVACFSSVKNHNVLGPHLFPIFTTRQQNPFATPRTVLQRSKKSLCNRSQFRTLLLPHRFIKIRPSHLRPVSSEFLTICRMPGFPKSEQNPLFVERAIEISNRVLGWSLLRWFFEEKVHGEFPFPFPRSRTESVDLHEMRVSSACSVVSSASGYPNDEDDSIEVFWCRSRSA